MSLSAAVPGSAFGASDENPFPPKKIVMAEPAAYSPLTYLGKVSGERSPKLAFAAETARDAEEWRKKLRAALWDLMGESHAPGARKAREYPASRA